jgi:hypothetical protein
MRRRPCCFAWLTLFALAAPTASGQGPPALRESSAWDVRRFGAVGDGATDCTDAFQRAVDAAARGPTRTVFVPPGRFLLKRPVFVDSPQVRLTGMGDDSLVVAGSPFSPALVFGLRRVEKDDRAVDARFRPDVFGKLDRSAAPARGQRAGLATQGRVFLMAVAHPVQVGMRTTRTADRHFDYWGEMAQFTLELCVEPPPGTTWPPGAPIVGMGDDPGEPGPWFLTTGSNDGQGLRFVFKTSDIPEGRNEGARAIEFPLAGARPPYRLRVTIDFDAGKAAAWVNERLVSETVTLHTANDRPWKPGLRFSTGRARYPFLVGTLGESPSPGDTKVTPLNLYGLRVSRTVRGRPSGDAEAYLNADKDTIAYLPLTGVPGRVIDLHSGGAADGQPGTAFLIHGDAFSGGIRLNAVTDLQVHGSPGVLIGSALAFRMERVRAQDGMVGFGSIPLAASYPVTVRDCEFNGFDAAVSLWRCEVRASGVDFERWGQTALRLHGCSASMQDMMFYFNTEVSESAVDILAGEGWGRYSLRNLNVDSEERGFRRAVVRCEASAWTQGMLEISGLEVSKSGKDAAILELIGYPESAGLRPQRVEAHHLHCYNHDQAAVLRVNDPSWYGHVDVSMMKAPHLDYRGKTGTTSVKLVSERRP